MSIRHHFLPLCRHRRECVHASEVVGRMCQQEQLLESLTVAIHCLLNSADRLAPTKHLFDAFAFALTDGVIRSARRGSIYGRATRARIVLRRVGRDAIGAAQSDESGCVVVLARAHRNVHASKSHRIGDACRSSVSGCPM
jgi:hypothetical protein